MAPLLSIEGVSKEFHVRGTRIAALDPISLAVDEREFVTLIGPSGRGNSRRCSPRPALAGIIIVAPIVVLGSEAINWAEAYLLRWGPTAEAHPARGPTADVKREVY